MTRVVRYLLRELLGPLLVWLAFLFLLLFVMQFLRATDVLLGSAVTAGDLGRLVAFLTPHFLVMAIPVAFLLAILLGFGRLNEDRELTALHALGVGPAQILVVPLAIGLGLGAITFALASTVEPLGLGAVKGLINEVIKKNVVGDVKAGVFYDDLSDLTVYAQGVDEQAHTWENVLIHDDRDPAAPLLVLAHRGGVNPSGQGEALALTLADGQVHRANRATSDYTVLGFERAEINVGVADKLVRKNRFRSPREEMLPGELLQAARQEQKEGRSPLPYLMAWWARFGLALTPVAFALLGAPLAMGRRGAGPATGFLLTIAAYVGYYVISRMFENLGTQGRVPLPVAALAPCLAISALGALAMWRVLRAGTSR